MNDSVSDSQLSTPSRELAHSLTYLPTLDGWRAVAILCVLVGHERPASYPWLPLAFFKGADFGVDIFFALSGFLICTRLLAEEQKSGSISLRSFYIRRVFRIQPAALTYLLVIGLLGMLHVVPIAPLAFAGALFLFENWVRVTSFAMLDQQWYTAHFWSLSVEEHFYLLLPGFLKLVRRRRVRVLAATIIVLEAWKYVALNHPRLQTGGWAFPHRTDMLLDSILVGAFAAVALQKPRIFQAARKWLSPWLAIVVFALLPRLLYGHLRFVSLFVSICCFPLLITSTVLHPKNILSCALELAPLRYVGRLSYSLYLWQQLTFRASLDITVPWKWLAFVQLTPCKWVFTFAVSMLSFYLIEKPLIRKGHQMAQRGQRGARASRKPPKEHSGS